MESAARRRDETPEPSPALPGRAPREGWILAGTLDGEASSPGPLTDVCGMPNLLRLACTLRAAGVARVVVVWRGASAPPDLAHLAADARLGGASLTLVHQPPPAPGGDQGGAGDDAILIVRADRVFHRDLPKTLARACVTGASPVLELDGDDYDSVLVAPRRDARALAEASDRPGGLVAELDVLRARGDVARVTPPWGGFSTGAAGPGGLRRAERRLVTSLRKPIDGLASKYVNRYVSLALTRLLMRTGVRPNHVSLFNMLAGVVAGIVCAMGGYWYAVAGVLLLELGSVVDGTDGELARLKYWPSRLGEWLDTLTDDLSTLSFLAGMALNLHAAGVSWAAPAALAGAVAFVLTQGTVYYYLVRVYKTGDLLAFRWDGVQFPRDDVAGRPPGILRRLMSGLQFLARRDTFVTVYVFLALAGRLDVALFLTSLGTVSVFLMLVVQGARGRLAPAP